MNNLLKRIAVSIVGFSTIAMMAPGVAFGLTAEELEQQINDLLATLTAMRTQLAQLQGTTAPAAGVPTACSGISFDRNLQQGMSGNDVKCMQALLNQSADTQVSFSGAGSPGSETAFFGGKTKAAVVKYQKKQPGFAGSGWVGPKTRALLNDALAGGEVVPPPPPPPPPSGAGENKVSLAADTPAARTIAKGAQNVIFAKVNFCAASEENTVSQLTFTRTGVAADTDISNVKLYEGSTQVGSTQAINSTTHKAVFSSLTWKIAANSCKALTLTASIAAGASQGNNPRLEISLASDITSTVALDGVFPIQSNSMTIAGIAVGALQVATTTPSGSVVAGGKEQGIAGFILTASSSEGVKVTSIKITEVGSSVNEDLSNIKLMYQSTQLGSTAVALDSSGSVVFDLSAAPLEILAGTSKTLTVYVDVGQTTGIKDRTIQFEVTDKNNVSAYGTNSGGTVLSWGGSVWNTTDDTWPQKAASITINLGSMTIAQDTAYSPSAQSYTRGTVQNKIISFKFTSGANENVRITSIKLRSASGAGLPDASVANVTLYDAVTGEQLKDTAGNLVPAAGMSSAYITFGSYTTGLDSVGLFDIPKSTFKQILVKADIPQGSATATGILGFEINNPTTQVWADGIESKNDIPAASINAGSTTKIPSTPVTHDISEKGTLTVSVNSGTPSAANYGIGTTAFTLAKFDLTTTGEDVKVTQMNISISTSSNATTTYAEAADVNSAKLYDGETLLASDAQLSSGYFEFPLTGLVITKATTKTLTLVVDIPTGSDANQLQAWVEKRGDVTASGQSSNVTIYSAAADWSLVRSNTMTKGTPVVTVRAATTPATQSYIKNATGVSVLNLLLTATPTEDIKITRIQIAVDATSSATSTANTATTTFASLSPAGVSNAANASNSTGLGTENVKDYFGNIKLYDGSTQIGSNVPTFTAGTNYDYADFTGLSLVIPKGTTKVIDVRVGVSKGTSTGASHPAFFFGIATTTGASADISGAGIQSGTAATFAMTSGGVGGQPMYFGDAGSLTVAVSPDTPNSAIVMEGTTVALAKWKFTASSEGVKISKLRFDVRHSNLASSTVYVPEARIVLLATTSPTERNYAFDYSINGAATATCAFPWSKAVPAVNATTTDLFIAIMNSASSTCGTTNPGIAAGAGANATGTSGAVILYASPSGNSLQIFDYSNPYGVGTANASNAVDNLRIGLKYGGDDTSGREVFSRYTGVDANVIAGKVSIWDGDTKLAETSLSGQSAGQAIFNLSSDKEILIPKGSKTLTLKAEISDYLGAAEGSTILFSIGTSTIAASDTAYITAKGDSSGSTLGNDSIAMDAEKAGSEMWIYATYPKVSLNASSPSGSPAVGTSKEVFRFDVQNQNSSLDLDVNAIRFTIGTNASSAATDKAFKLYKSTDLTTIIGTAVSWAPATATAATVYVTMYPYSGNVVGAGSAVTYVLYGDTSAMNESSSKTETITISIENNDFYWDDSSGVLAGAAAANANQKVLNLPVTGNTLSY